MDPDFHRVVEAAETALNALDASHSELTLVGSARAFLVANAYKRCLAVLRYVVSLRQWTEDGFLLAASDSSVGTLERIRSAAPSLFLDYVGGLSSELGVLLARWDRDFGDRREADELRDEPLPRLLERLDLISATYIAAETLGELSKQADSVAKATARGDLLLMWAPRGKVAEEIIERCVDQLSLASEAIELAHGRHDRLFDSSSFPDFVWLQASQELQHLTEPGEPGQADERALSTRDLVLGGLRRIRDEVAAGTAPRTLETAWRHYGSRLYAELESEEFWKVVGAGFFRPEDWAERAKLLAPVSESVAVLKRLGLEREVKELYEGFIIGNWISVISLSRVVLERLIKHQLGIDPNERTQSLDKLANTWATKFGASNELREAVHRLKDSGNRRLHRSRLDLADLEESAMQTQAQSCLQTLHDVFAFSAH